MCMKFGLYDAMIYVYNNGLKDYATPMSTMLSMLKAAIKTARMVVP